MPGNHVQTIPATIHYGINTTVHYTEHKSTCAFLADDDVEELIKNGTVVCPSMYNNEGTRYDRQFLLPSVNHEILLAKLYIDGIQGVSEAWLRSYLTNKKFK